MLLISLSYSLKENFTIQLVPTGPPPPPGQMPLPNREIIQPDIPELHTARLAMRHQLDASASYTYHPKNAAWKTIFGLSLYNIYDQKNDYARGFFVDRNTMPSELKYSTKVDLGFTPNLVVRMEW